MPMSARVRQSVASLVGLILFGLALVVLRRELGAVSWRELSADILDTPPSRLGLAAVLTALNYGVLTGYDLLAFEYIGKRLSRVRIAAASFLAYAIANNVGFAVVSGASVRYRFYTRWGLTAEELARVVFFYTATFWLGLLLLGGLSVAVGSLPAARELPAEDIVRGVGWVLMLASAAYVAAAGVRGRSIRIGTLTIALPRLPIAAGQLLLSSIDWVLAGAVLYVLLPSGSVPFLGFLGSFLAAQLVGLASHIPGGVGIFEGSIILLLKPMVGAPVLLPALVVYRFIYYLVPLAVALVVLVADELRQRRVQTARATAFLGQLSEQLAPRVLAFFTFLAGVVLLLSGATPAAEGRLAILGRLLPLGVIETSHFAGSVVGAALLILSQGLARRLDAAYYLTMTLAAIGVATSILKGGDYEEAALVGALLVVLWRARPAFDRKAALFETPFSAGWIAAVVAAIGASIWLGQFAFKHVEYSDELWWQFELHGEASRFLRGSVGAAVVLLLFGIMRLIRPAPHEADPPSDDDLDAAGLAIASQTCVFANLVYLRDKALLFDDERRAFVMYGVQGRTWVALGDPIGPADRIGGLIRRFLERADDFGGVPVFYEVRKEHLHTYADVGLTFVKLGEEARVDLRNFTLAGGQARGLRQTLRRFERDGATYRIVATRDTPPIMDQLRAVSDDWLARKSGSEKGFSLGFFDPEYVSRFPVAVVERGGRIVAFATLWPGPRREELSMDLMRYHHDAPSSVMEALIINLLIWGRAQDYRWFMLGVAPLSGFDASPVAPLWTRLGAFLYEHGGALYNFQGLRAFKEKFHPIWEPRYLAYPGGLRLPRILADVSALIAGGYRKVFLK